MHLQRVNGQGWCLLSANVRTRSVLSFWSPFRLRSTFISRGWIVHSLQPRESFALLQGKSLLSGATDPGFLSSAFPGLWHEPAQAMEGQSYTWRKKGKECPWLCSVPNSPVLCTWNKSQSSLHHCKPGAFVGLMLLCPFIKEKLVQ